MTKPPKKPSITVWQLPRNDIEAVRRLWQDHEPSKDEWRVLLTLQDDPAQLLKQMKSWKRDEE